MVSTTPIVEPESHCPDGGAKRKNATQLPFTHCFQKKTEKASKTDLDLAAKRYRELQKELGP